MKILAFTDMHGKEAGVDNVLKRVSMEMPDLVIIAGDITDFGPAVWAWRFLDSIPVETIAIPGNCDPTDVIECIDRSKAVNLHAKRTEIDDIVFVGLGGSNPTPFNTPLEFTEQEIFEMLDKVMVEDSMLITHCPPMGKLDFLREAGHLGSESIQALVEKYKPFLVISGHIHEARGVVHKGTVYVNPGPAYDGCAALITIEPEDERFLIVNLLG